MHSKRVWIFLVWLWSLPAFAAMFGDFAVPDALDPRLHAAPGHNDRMAVLIRLPDGKELAVYFPERGDPVGDGQAVVSIAERLDHSLEVTSLNIGGRAWFGTRQIVDDGLVFYDGYMQRNNYLYPIAFSLDGMAYPDAEVKRVLSRIRLLPNLARSPSAAVAVTAADMLETGQMDEIEAVLEQAEAIDSVNWLVPYLRGRMASTTEEFPEALAHYRNAYGLFASDFELAARYYGARSMVEADQHDIDFLYNLGVSHPEEATIWEELGTLYLYGDDTDSAIDFFEEALNYNPSSETALYNLAFLYTEAGDYEAAFRKAREFTYHHPWMPPGIVPDVSGAPGLTKEIMDGILNEPLPIGEIAHHFSARSVRPSSEEVAQMSEVIYIQQPQTVYVQQDVYQPVIVYEWRRSPRYNRWNYWLGGNRNGWLLDITGGYPHWVRPPVITRPPSRPRPPSTWRPGPGGQPSRPRPPSGINRPGRPGSGNGSRPGRPGGGRPGQNGDWRPGRPGQGGGGSRPERPGDGQPEQGGGSRPGRPGQGDGSRPERPDDGGQGQDGGSRPGRPGQGNGSRPERPGTGRPDQNGGTRPGNNNQDQEVSGGSSGAVTLPGTLGPDQILPNPIRPDTSGSGSNAGNSLSRPGRPGTGRPSISRPGRPNDQRPGSGGLTGATTLPGTIDSNGSSTGSDSTAGSGSISRPPRPARPGQVPDSTRPSNERPQVQPPRPTARPGVGSVTRPATRPGQTGTRPAERPLPQPQRPVTRPENTRNRGTSTDSSGITATQTNRPSSTTRPAQSSRPATTTRPEISTRPAQPSQPNRPVARPQPASPVTWPKTGTSSPSRNTSRPAPAQPVPSTGSGNRSSQNRSSGSSTVTQQQARPNSGSSSDRKAPNRPNRPATEPEAAARGRRR